MYNIKTACITVLYKSLQLDVAVYRQMCVLLCVRKTELVSRPLPLSRTCIHTYTHKNTYATTLKIKCYTI